MFVACGLNYKTAPLNVREKIAPGPTLQNTLLHKLVGLPLINEAAILSTCNRTEIYCDTSDASLLATWLAEEYQFQPNQLSPYLYTYYEDEGVQHALRVASGLDSMMLGEPQILGQMKQAYADACRSGTVHQTLRPIFQYIFNASKRIRQQSGIGKNPISIASAAVQLIGKSFPSHRTHTVFIIGAGETSSLIAKYLSQAGFKHFMIASRTKENATALATLFSGEAFAIQDLNQCLSRADIVISATACPLPFIHQNLVKEALDKRAYKPMLFLDLSIPRDIEPDVAELDAVQLYNIDDLQHLIDEGMDKRRLAARTAEELIHNELHHYARWQRSRKANPLISDYRQQMQQLAQQELKRAFQKLSAGQCQHAVLTEFSHRLVNKLTHSPSVALREAASDNQNDLLKLAHVFFNKSLDYSSL